MNARSYKKREVEQSDGLCGIRIVDAEAVTHVRALAADEVVESRAVAMFSALSDPTRLRILRALSVRELCVCDLAAITGVSESGVSHQLRVLRDRELVSFRRDGQRAVYRLADDHVKTLMSQAFAHAEESQ